MWLQRLPRRGVRVSVKVPLLLMHSAGGSISVDEARRMPIGLAGSRPAAGGTPAGRVGVMRGGAYGFTWASTYTPRPRAAEVLVHGSNYHVIRARERIEALWEGESFPEWIEARERSF